MIDILKLWKKLLGSDNSSEKIEAKNEEAYVIKAQTLHKVIRAKQNIDRINKELKGVGQDLHSITVRIAYGMGRIRK